MITLQNLSASTSESPWVEPRGILQVVCNMPAPGVIRKITLGEGGIILSRGQLQVGIPLEELLALAEKHLPGFAVAAPAPATQPAE